MSYDKSEPPSYDDYNTGSQAAIAAAASQSKMNGPMDTEICDFPDHPSQHFEEVFMEPKAYKENAVGAVLSPINSKIFGSIFDYTQSAVYYVLCVILGIFLGLIWGIIFAVNNYVIVWITQPAIKLVFTWMRLAAILVRAVIRAMLDPFWESVGLSLSFIRTSINVDVSGLRSLMMLFRKPADPSALQPV